MTKIVIVGEAWGREEAAIKRPFIGATGRELNRLCEEAGLIPLGSAQAISPNFNNTLWHKRDQIYGDAGIHLTNVFNFQPPSKRIPAICGPRTKDIRNLPALDKGKYLRPEFYSELDRLDRELKEHEPNLIIALGGVALWYLARNKAITKSRGSIALSAHGKYLPTFHPAFLFRGAWKMRSVVIFDLMKAKREAEFPEVRRPERFVYVPESIGDIEAMLPELRGAARLSVDIETVGNQITCIGFAWSPQHVITIPIFYAGQSYWSYQDELIVWRLIRYICELPVPKLFQNGLFDIHFLWRQYGITVADCEDDTMLLHHSLYPELLKGLGFLGSIYTNESSWKQMRAFGKSDTVKDRKEE